MNTMVNHILTRKKYSFDAGGVCGSLAGSVLNICIHRLLSAELE